MVDFVHQPSTASLSLSELPTAAKFFKISLVKGGGGSNFPSVGSLQLSLFAVVYDKIINSDSVGTVLKLPLHIKEWKKPRNLIQSNSTFP